MTRWLLVIVIGSMCSTAHADSAAVAKEIAKQRGLNAKKTAREIPIDRDVLRARLAKLAEDPAVQAATRAEGIALARWGLIPIVLDYRAALVALYTDEIDKRAADVAWNELVTTERDLRDGKFDFTTFETVPAGEGDASLARQALVEGDGVALLIELVLARKGKNPPWGNPQVTAELAKAMTEPTGDALDRAPVAIREAMRFPYSAGLAFVAALRRDEPWSAIDAAYKRPPRSTEQILHPDKYIADEKPVAVTIDVPTALRDAKLVHSTVWGELGFALFLRAHGIATETANLAAAGWAGDRVATLAFGDVGATADRAAGNSIGLAQFEWDTEADAIEAQEAAVRAIDDTTVGATVDHADTRTRWLALDGKTALVERHATTVVIAVGVPARLLESVTADVEASLARRAPAPD